MQTGEPGRREPTVIETQSGGSVCSGLAVARVRSEFPMSGSDGGAASDAPAGSGSAACQRGCPPAAAATTSKTAAAATTSAACHNGRSTHHLRRRSRMPAGRSRHHRRPSRFYLCGRNVDPTYAYEALSQGPRTRPCTASPATSQGSTTCNSLLDSCSGDHSRGHHQVSTASPWASTAASPGNTFGDPRKEVEPAETSAAGAYTASAGASAALTLQATRLHPVPGIFPGTYREPTGNLQGTYRGLTGIRPGSLPATYTGNPGGGGGCFGWVY